MVSAGIAREGVGRAILKLLSIALTRTHYAHMLAFSAAPKWCRKAIVGV